MRTQARPYPGGGRGGGVGAGHRPARMGMATTSGIATGRGMQRPVPGVVALSPPVEYWSPGTSSRQLRRLITDESATGVPRTCPGEGDPLSASDLIVAVRV